MSDRKWTQRLDRRTFLRGVLGGAAVTIGLPILEASFGRRLSARAAEGAFPTRFGLFFWGNGMHPARWVPDVTGPDWTPAGQLAPLAGVKGDLTVLTGLEVKTDNYVAHASGPGGFLSGQNLIVNGEEHTFAGPSFDQIMATEIGGETLFRSLEVGVEPGCAGLSHNGPDSTNPPESDPAKLFERLFGPSFTAPGEEPILDPTLALRRSVLDSVMEDAKSLKGVVGNHDKLRIDQHLASVRDLELRIARLEDDPPSLAACSRPTAPGEIPDIDGRPQMSARSHVVSDLVTMAFACDMTRVLHYTYSDPLSDVLYPGATAGHHQLTHDEPGEQPIVDGIVTSIMADFAYFIEALRGVPEGDETLLDHCAILATSDTSYGRTHQIDEFPLLLAGRAGGAFTTGFHYRSETNHNACVVPLSLLRAMGVFASEFGVDAGRVTEGLSAIEV